ncbi:MAG: hypothetical protein ABJG55_01935 [Paracoccaceae bacterium]
MQRRPSNAKPDCEEKRDPDKRSLITQKKENELDPDTQLERQTFATSAKAPCQIGKADVQVLVNQNWDAALHDKVSYAQITIFVPIYFKIDQVNLCSNAVHISWRSQQLNQ